MEETTSSSLQARFVVAHSSGDFMRMNFTIAYIQLIIHEPNSLLKNR